MRPRRFWMRHALSLAARARGRTAPNPMVGAAVVTAGRLAGEGWHPGPGLPHAEVYALRHAGEAARGADLYVTLEPCCHHGRTPPCTDAVVRAGIRRVFVAMPDPDSRVNGSGIRQLRESGVKVEVGLLAAEAARLNAAYLKARRTGLPWVHLKMATSLDGKTATRTGESRWITGPEARAHVHTLRDTHDAVMVGAGTFRADDPLLTARGEGQRSPTRVIVSAGADLPRKATMWTTLDLSPVIVLCGDDASTADLEALGVRVLRVPLREGRVDLGAGLGRLCEAGIHSLLCEGGAALAGELLARGQVNELSWFLSGRLIGGTAAPGAVGDPGVDRLTDAPHLQGRTCTEMGDDLLVHGFLEPGSEMGVS